MNSSPGNPKNASPAGAPDFIGLMRAALRPFGLGEVLLLLAALYAVSTLIFSWPLMNWLLESEFLKDGEVTKGELQALGEAGLPTGRILLYCLSILPSAFLFVLLTRALSLGPNAMMAGGVAALVSRSLNAAMQLATAFLLFLAAGVVASLPLAVLVGFGLPSQILLPAVVALALFVGEGAILSVAATALDRPIGVLAALSVLQGRRLTFLSALFAAWLAFYLATSITQVVVSLPLSVFGDAAAMPSVAILAIVSFCFYASAFAMGLEIMAHLDPDRGAPDKSN